MYMYGIFNENKNKDYKKKNIDKLKKMQSGKVMD